MPLLPGQALVCLVYPDLPDVFYPQETETYYYPDLEEHDNIVWTSFPVVNDLYNQDDERYNNELTQMLEPYTFAVPPDDPLLAEFHWMLRGDEDWAEYRDQVWTHPAHPITPPYGYKLRFNTDDVFEIELTGRLANAETDAVPLYSENDEEETYTNWLGYFHTQAQDALDAFSREIPGDPGHTYLDYMYMIQTQKWTLVREEQEPGSPWVESPNHEPFKYALGYGDCVVVKVFANAPERLFWNTSEEVAAYVPEEVSFFSYTEDFEYTPVFIHTDPANPPVEIAAFVDSTCIGAAVVEDTLTLVRAYLPSLNRGDNGELTVVSYYGGRSGYEYTADYRVFDPETRTFEQRKVDLREGADYYRISLCEPGSGGTGWSNGLRKACPNPFNPETTIRFSLAQAGPARMHVYNVRGQRVATLVDETLEAGEHQAVWRGRDNNDRPCASGVYLVRLRAGDFVQTRKLLLLK